MKIPIAAMFALYALVVTILTIAWFYPAYGWPMAIAYLAFAAMVILPAVFRARRIHKANKRHILEEKIKEINLNLVKTCPDIPDNWRGGIGATAEILGLDRSTVRKYAKLGKRNGGIDSKPKPNGKLGMIFYGREIKRFWHLFS